ncbi:MAG: hypothetical protein U1E14_06925 [Geminicoccaceae bacterium]
MNTQPRRRLRRHAVPLLLLPLLAGLAGCESFGRGIAQAVMSGPSDPTADVRMCEGEGKPVGGIEPLLAEQDGLGPIVEGDTGRPALKLLYVHGIGTHLVGHGAELINNVGRALGLDVRAPRTKRIELQALPFPGETVGELNLTRLTDQARQRDLVFMELTWSGINAEAKEALAFDSSDVYQSRRASLNGTLRSFVNDVAPDPVAYAGVRGTRIMSSVLQSICWAFSTTWSALPENTVGKTCGPELAGFGSRVDVDELAIITHSLGSRATLDALARIAKALPEADERYRSFANSLRQHDLTVFMLSNQLPLLEAGANRAPITGQADQFCGDASPRAAERFVRNLNVVAFSDPNDLMSYPVPEAWARKYLDSRLCANVTNIDINVATISSVLGIGNLANPLAAHTGYAADERVGGILAKGMGTPNVAPIVAERCTWRATDERLMN